MSFERGDHHARLLRWHSVCVEVYASYFQQELGDVVKEGVGDVPGPAGFRRLRVLPKVSLGHFRGEDVEVTFPGAAEAQLFVNHGIDECISNRHTYFLCQDKRWITSSSRGLLWLE